MMFLPRTRSSESNNGPTNSEHGLQRTDAIASSKRTTISMFCK
jgi:hypothetical protein